MANKEVKFSEEEMKKISELQNTYVNLQNIIGQLGVARIRLTQQLDDLDASEDNIKSQFSDNQTKEKEFVKSINKKYGDGNLNLETGVFLPKPTKETSDKTL